MTHAAVQSEQLTVSLRDPFASIAPPIPARAFQAPARSISAPCSDPVAELLATGLLITRPNPYFDAGWSSVGLASGPEYTFAIKDMRVGGRFARMDDLMAERRAEKLLADVLAGGGSDDLAREMGV